jgi:hypothetical protein
MKVFQIVKMTVLCCPRYDGIYKVRKYWPEQGKAGFIVWRYMLERKVVQPHPPLPP